ncbi:hypothetical protein RJ40_12835 [Methanofollis aquaemaris]|uniref:Uncharacterized protein n=1 Tax=Methanofollis aquaemaris TaxID=126734 RepID=A0A8A3SAB6_9EURY|nr:hypothetical protein [Methanofollis aquaemaris]QSZ68316.1 hypothetical protein RJ40_12835 [Methanofollis aquaemaris]
MKQKGSEISILIILLLIGVVGIPGVTVPGLADRDSPPGETAPATTPPSSPLMTRYNSEEFTVINIADGALETGLDPATLEKESRALLEIFTERFGESVAPRYLGLAGVTLPEDTKIGAYLFRVLPTGETLQYIGLCGRGCQDYSGVIARAEEWKETLLIPRTDGTLTMGSNPQPIATVTMDCEYIGREYGGDYGYAGITSILSWDCEENDRVNDYFFVRTMVVVDAGMNRVEGSVFHNNIFEISHDWMHHDSPGFEPLPYVCLSDYSPGQNPGPAEVEISLMPRAIGSPGTPLSWWTCAIPDGEVRDDSHPADELAKWDLTFDYGAGDSQADFTFDPGSAATCSQSPARDGGTYSVCRVEMDCHRGWFYDGFFFFDETGPENAGPLGYTFFSWWEEGLEDLRD